MSDGTSDGLSIMVASPGYRHGYDDARHRWRSSYLIPDETTRVDISLADNVLDESDTISWVVSDLDRDHRYPPITGQFTVADYDELIEGVIHDHDGPGRERGRTGPKGRPSSRKMGAYVPVHGGFHVEVTLRGRSGVRKLSGDGAVEDWLVVCLGDSLLAGQGNPDTYGRPGFLVPSTMTSVVVQQLAGADEYARVRGKPPVWLERKAWRSFGSATTMACRQVSDERRQMRLVHVASSGAQTMKGLLGPQRAFQSEGQIDEVGNLLAPRTGRMIRRPDLVLISIGGNDVGFATHLRDMATNLDSILNLSSAFDALKGGGLPLVTGYIDTLSFDLPDVEAAFDTALSHLESNLDVVSDRLEQVLDPRAVIVTEYPEGLFNNADGDPAAACGVFDSEVLLGASITETEATFIAGAGARLNQVLRDWCGRHGYYFAEGVAADFARHGYCAEDTYFVSAEESVRRQLDVEGVMHPNATGHRKIAGHLADAMHRAIGELGGPSFTAGGAGSRVRDHRQRPEGPIESSRGRPAGPAGRAAEPGQPRTNHRIQAHRDRPTD